MPPKTKSANLTVEKTKKTKSEESTIKKIKTSKKKIVKSESESESEKSEKSDSEDEHVNINDDKSEDEKSEDEKSEDEKSEDEVNLKDEDSESEKSESEKSESDDESVDSKSKNIKHFSLKNSNSSRPVIKEKTIVKEKTVFKKNNSDDKSEDEHERDDRNKKRPDHIDEEKFIKMDEKQFSKITNDELACILFIRLKKSGNPLSRDALHIHRTLINPIGEPRRHYHHGMDRERGEGRFTRPDRFEKHERPRFGRFDNPKNSDSDNEESKPKFGLGIGRGHEALHEKNGPRFGEGSRFGGGRGHGHPMAGRGGGGRGMMGRGGGGRGYGFNREQKAEPADPWEEEAEIKPRGKKNKEPKDD